MKRNLDVVVISDVHLGTFGCKAQELLAYLQSINPKKIILNGDIVDIWNFKKSYFPETHLQIISYLLNLSEQGIPIVYITGNHDELLRKFTTMRFGNILLTDKYMLKQNDKVAWIFHGDVFDASIQHSKWIAKLGGWGYDKLIQLNYFINKCLEFFGRERYSLSQKIKNSVKKAVKHINDFEQTAAELAIENEYDYVVCGHIHQPQLRKVKTDKGICVYMNSGDWIENLSALECVDGNWSVFYFEEHKHTLMQNLEEIEFNYSLDELIVSILNKK
ncbi:MULTISPECIES: UDP-2,3-diacylglucosamine diphosphatase [Empedobacter]|uniref:UDP-2,3-diacylglucosamine diphosphatase n=1 Tax=Empedobacter TaxID=59734 RepID=UPI000571BD34|nr:MULTISPECIES: UDP-2,3-diacylglucosamine diphosphatase [Empedobacter]MDH0659476.1 UDP-2,3-diacylglucosamine diphosphatase [Empedobacter sp. GD03865]MDH1603958.1 UDP-2,3-diacylglucosamine diphosphatase [Empedobacter sp. GD03739]MDM1137702.1 UDP-2,3-diacylglucosamine diphosphatase [Empedobacter sp. R132-2]